MPLRNRLRVDHPFLVVPALVALVLSAVFPRTAEACSCPEMKPPCDISENPSIVFYGRVIEVSAREDIWLDFFREGAPETAPDAEISREGESEDEGDLEIGREHIREHLAEIMSIEQKRVLEETDSVEVLTQLVIDLYQSTMDRKVRFEVLEAFRNVTDSELLVVTDTPDPIRHCLHGFRLGEEYIVYAKQGSENGPITVRGCTRSAAEADAGPDLAFWRSYRPDSKTGRIFGVVASGRSKGHEGAVVTLEGDGIAERAVTDNKGTYSFDNVPAGDYTFSAVFEPLQVERSPREATLVGGGCSKQDFWTRRR